MNIITSYGTGNMGSMSLTLYKQTYDQYREINLIGFNRTEKCSKDLFPLMNGGINKLTISSDELVTSQYDNGYKTMTLAELAVSPSYVAGILEKPQTWMSLKFFYTLSKHVDIQTCQHFPDVDGAATLNFYPMMYPDRISSFHCNSDDAIRLFDFVVTKKQSSFSSSAMSSPNNVLSYPNDMTDNTRVGELRIDIDQLKLIANQWLLECNLYCPGDNYNSKPPHYS